MYDAGKIIAGIIIFLGIVTFPLWYNGLSGKSTTVPDLKIVTKEKQCVEATPYMKASHMKLLDQWRNKVVRENARLYRGVSGKTYTISLSNTCLECHSNKDEFCDKCHNYVGVTPTCWNCHVIPEERS